MKKLFILSTISLALFVLNINGMAQPSPTWVARYNGPAGKNDQARAMAVDASGYIYVTGPSDGSKNANIDYATVKYDPVTHQQMWVARYNGSGNGEDWPYAIAVDGAGNVYVTGRSVGNGTNLDYVTVKYSPGGVQRWVARYNSPGSRNDIAKAIAVDAAGNVFVTGAADAENVLGNPNAATTVKYDSLGHQIHVATYDALSNDNSNTEAGNSIALDATGNLYVAGNSAGALIIKYDSSLQSQWFKNIAGGDAHKVLVDASNNVLVTGWTGQTFKYSSNSSGDLIWQATNSSGAFWDMALDPAGNVYVTGEGSDYLTEKYDGSTGATLWSKIYVGSGSGPDFARSIALDGAGNVYVTGHCTVKNGRSSLICAGSIKYDNSGAQKWVALYDSAAKLNSDGFVVATDVNGNVYVAGQGISNAKATDFDFLTIKYAQGSNGFVTKHSDATMENNGVAVFTLQTYPNPFYNSTTIQYELPHDGKVRLAIYDLAGKEIATLVNEAKPAGVHKVNFGAGKLSSGTYLCKIQCGDLTKTKELIILK